jgi:hypothetical protein
MNPQNAIDRGKTPDSGIFLRSKKFNVADISNPIYVSKK